MGESTDSKSTFGSLSMLSVMSDDSFVAMIVFNFVVLFNCLSVFFGRVCFSGPVQVVPVCSTIVGCSTRFRLVNIENGRVSSVQGYGDSRLGLV